MGYGLSQVWFMIIGISYPPSWWTQNAMGYWRLWVITVWVISGLTVSEIFDYGLKLAVTLVCLQPIFVF